MIVNAYQAHPNTNAVFLLGHIPVPYSGELNPDAHSNHKGAWPADLYYGDMDGAWTDAIVSNVSAARTANHNIPGDGKFDQTAIPSDIELQVGRVDFANMTVFGKTEVQLMRNYLGKDHKYKMDSITVVKRGLVDDNFGGFGGEAFAVNAWRNFSPLMGRDSTRAGDLIDTLDNYSYQWSYGCGGGSFTTAGGIGVTLDFSTNDVNGIFMMLFGSYFGDWDSQNNFLRAPLCSNNPALTNAWAGRPHWFFHHMALGETIGFSTRLTQNNFIYTPTGYSNREVHVALMGDPALRSDYIKPVANMTIAGAANQGATVSWTASPDAAVIGYYVYRADSMYGVYSMLSSMVSGTTYTDAAGINGKKYYMVRPVKLQSTPSGSYYNLGVGVVDSAMVTFPNSVSSIDKKELDLTLFPNPAKSSLNLSIESSHAASATITVYDVSGREVLQTIKSLRMGSNTCTIDAQSLTPGIYLLQARTNRGVATRSFARVD
jgi:hypothetical protein